MPLFFLIIVILAGIVIYYYNGLVRKKNIVAQYWSNIDVQLKKRYNLIPNLVNTVKGYAAHEKETLENVVKARSEAMQAKTITSQQTAENELEKSLVGLFVVSESYPDLKANENFMDLQLNLLEIEKDIQIARERYNVAVRENNVMIESFPANLVAQQFNFEKAFFFELENDLERQLQKIDAKEFSNPLEMHRDND